MNVLVLLAGEGKRFTDVGITTPKPLIQINGRSILEWTTRSLPIIQHHLESIDTPIRPNQMYFAIREEHESLGIEAYLKDLYGDDINIISFKKTKDMIGLRGNLDTALISAMTIENSDQPLLILDADNKYDHNNMIEFLNEAYDVENSMVVTCFEPLDDNSKWAFAMTDGSIVTKIVEKDPTAIAKGGKPLVGAFWFHSTDQFIRYADFIVGNGYRSGVPGREEFYVSQVASLHATNKRPVFAHTVTNVMPLGTPEDVEIFINHVSA